MSTSPSSSLETDLGKDSTSRCRQSRSADSFGISGKRLSRQMSRTRTHSRNFSRPSQSDSVDSTDQNFGRRRSSDDLSELAQFHRSNYWNENSPGSRLSTHRSASRNSIHMPGSRTSIHLPVSRSSMLAPGSRTSVVSPEDRTGAYTPGNRSSAHIPVFAQKAVEPKMLHGPSYAELPSPAPTYRPPMQRSTDVLNAARDMQYSPGPGDSLRSLTSLIQQKNKLPASTFAERVFEAGKPDLLYDLKTSHQFKDSTDGVLDLTTLQRMSQHVIQQKLVEQVKAIGDKGAWMEIGIRETLREYCRSIKVHRCERQTDLVCR